MKIQTKTTLLFTALTATVFLILNITVYFFLSEFAHTDFNKRVELRARISAKFRFEKDSVSTESFRELQRQYLEKLPEEKAFIIEVDKESHTPKTVAPEEIPRSYIRDIIEAGGNTVFRKSKYRHYAGFLYNDRDEDHIVIKSATNNYGSSMMRQLGIIKLITFICAVVLIYSVGMYFSKKTFKPFRQINNRVKQINQSNLHLRLEHQEGADEIAELSRTFNEMLDRLETAFEAQNNFISNASHELRTPLTAIVAEADYILSRERTAEAYRQSLHNIMNQAEKLQLLTNGLLSLAQTGFNKEKQSWDLVRLDQLLFDVKENVGALLPDNKVKIALCELPGDDRDMSIKGNYDLLKIAITNIVINACKYSDNQEVTVRLELSGGEGIIAVADKGIGIPDSEIKHIYDPFFRASNAQEYAGYGVGMPLTDKIVRLHRGKIDVQSLLRVGTTVRVILPLV